MAKPKVNACIICSKEVEGELKLRQGWLCYDKGGSEVYGVDPVAWTPLCLQKGVHNAENTPAVSGRVPGENG